MPDDLLDVPAPGPDPGTRPDGLDVQPAKRRRRPFRMVLRLVLWTLIAGNVVIHVSSLVTSRFVPSEAVADVDGVENLYWVDDKVMRGGDPERPAFAQLDAIGVTTVVDLRAETDAAADDALIESLGMEVIHLPIRDGQVPNQGQRAAFVDAVESADGLVLVHCGAGVGRTGAMSAAYLQDTGQASQAEATLRSVGVGPMTLEQISYAAGIEAGPLHSVVTLPSRWLDGPRRTWHFFNS